MLSELLVVASLAFSPGQCSTCGPSGGGMEFSPGMSSGSWTAGSGGFSNPYDSVSAGGGGGQDQLFPYDSPEPWLHGYFQEMPAYGGYHTFRPHNYKHVLSQMDVAGRWGLSPPMAYSHQWSHRYRQRSGMHPNYDTPQVNVGNPGFQNYAQLEAPPAGGPAGTSPFSQFSAVDSQLQQAAAIERGYPGTAIPGITTPVFQLSRNLRHDSEPQQNLSEEYIDRFEGLQKQLEEQTFQMQVLQQQLQDKSRLPAWQQPNHLQFQNGTSQQPAMAQAGQFGNGGGYQELAPPPGSAMQPPGLLNVQPSGYGTAPNGAVGYPQESYVIPGYPQDPLQQSYPQQPAYPQSYQQGYPQPGYQPQSYPQQDYQPQSYPQQGYQQQAYPQQGYQTPQSFQQPMNSGYPMSPASGQPAYNQPAQPGPILQVPAGQAYFSNQQRMPQMASAAQYGQAGYGSPMSSTQAPIPGTQAVYQQPATAGNYSAGNYSAVPMSGQQPGYVATQPVPAATSGYSAPQYGAPRYIGDR